MKIKCDKCGKTLRYKGALIFSPPKIRFIGEFESSEKIHICGECFIKLLKWLKENRL